MLILFYNIMLMRCSLIHYNIKLLYIYTGRIFTEFYLNKITYSCCIFNPYLLLSN